MIFDFLSENSSALIVSAWGIFIAGALLWGYWPRSDDDDNSSTGGMTP